MANAFLIKKKFSEESFDALREEVFAKLQDFGFSPNDKSRDIFIVSASQIGLPEVTDVKDFLSKASDESKLLVIIYGYSISGLAQNALLKVSEDLSNGGFLVVATEETDSLLPTLKSRLFVLDAEVSEIKDKKLEKQIKELAKMSVKERLDFVGEYLSEEDDHDSHELRSRARYFFETLESEYRKKDLDFLEFIYKSKLLLKEQGASAKQLIETAVMTLPE